MDEFVKDFLVESQEGLARFETQLLELERDPGSKPLLSSIFRIIHSLKGSAGFLGFERLTELAHVGEDLLGKLREGELVFGPAIAGGLLAMVDALRLRLAAIESEGRDVERDDSLVIDRLRKLQADGPEAAIVETSGAVPPPEPEPLPVRPELVVPNPEPVVPSPAPPVVAPEPATAAEAVPHVGLEVAETTIRVDVGLLDRLMTLVGELVLARNQVLRCRGPADAVAFQAASQRLDHVTTELQEGMMKTRMQPIRTVWAKLPRVVRDLAHECGKQARLVTEGEDTELDRTVIEAIKDPLTHVVRNALDHGLEPPEERRRRGKPAEGLLRLRAAHEGGQVRIEVSDDGAGIDPVKVRRKAVERGLLSAEQAAALPDRDVLGLIFRPGFSTAEALTRVSGRGVGMDVVKSRIEAIGGVVEVRSELGRGTAVTMTIPLTLTIINALLVTARGHYYAIPQVSLVELVRLRGQAVRKGIEVLQGAAIYRHRGRLLPLVDLNAVLGLGAADGRETEAVHLVVVQGGERRYGLIVDAVEDAQEIVVRPLARSLQPIAAYAGATILGDGQIALILDVFGLARSSGILEGGPAGQDSGVRTLPASDASTENAVRRPYLVARGADGGRIALPLESVEHIEVFDAGAIETLGGRALASYRGALIPLLAAPTDLSGSQRVVILSGAEDDARGRVGLAVSGVEDIVEEVLEVRGGSGRAGVSFTAQVAGRLAEVLDVGALRRIAEASRRADETSRSVSL